MITIKIILILITIIIIIVVLDESTWSTQPSVPPININTDKLYYIYIPHGTNSHCFKLDLYSHQ